MNLAVALERLEQLCQQPSAVRRFREVILESAIRGRLSDQCTHDLPATELLRTITAARLSESKRYVASPPLTDAESWFQLPHRWVWTRLGEIGRLFNGDSVSEAGKTELAKVGAGLPFIATKDIGYGSETIAYENGLKVKPGDTRFKVAKANAVLICAEGGSAGRKIALTDRDICFGNKLYANETWDGVDPRFVYYVYQAPSFYRAFVANMTGIIGGISRSELLSLPFPLPPSAEQKRIVAKVDEVMALCDRLEAQLQERDARSADLAKAALAKFSEEPTVENLEYLFHPSFNVTIAELRLMILAAAVEGVLVPFPTQTVVGVAGDHVDFLNGYAFKSEWFRSNGVRLCRNINVGHGELSWSDSECVSESIATEFRRFELASGDVVLSLDRPVISTGLKAARIRAVDLPCLLLQRVAKVSPKHSGIDLDFFFLWLQSPAFVDSIDPGRSNGVPHISTKQVAALPIKVPPLAEQRRIVAKVEELMDLVDQLEAQLAASEETGTKLLDALVAELAPSN